MPFLLVFLLSPVWIVLGIIVLIAHPFSGAYYLFNRWDYEAVGRYKYLLTLGWEQSNL